jgi:hypothetical protein
MRTRSPSLLSSAYLEIKRGRHFYISHSPPYPLQAHVRTRLLEQAGIYRLYLTRDVDLYLALKDTPFLPQLA